MIAIAVASIAASIVGAIAGKWTVRRFLGIVDEPSGRQLAQDVLAATADRRVTAAERERLRDESQRILDGTEPIPVLSRVTLQR